jgi:L,D-transpeptidase catalytic domain
MLNSRVAMLRLSLTVALVGLPAMVLTAGTRTSAAPVEVAAPTAGPAVEVAPAAAEVTEAGASAFDAASWDEAAIGDIDPTVFETALRAAANAVQHGDVPDPGTLTVIDFSRRSTEKRMWVYDLRSRTLLFDELVSHGRGSGQALASTFSNDAESNRSSLGLYRTGETYIGKHGYSLRLDGLEPGFNDHARQRGIVMHAAEYVNAATARAQGYLGRSLGCPALRPEITKSVIDAVKGGGLLFAYYPDQHYLQKSKYLS